MEKIRTLTARKYYLLSSNRYYVFKGHKKYEESLLLKITNDGGYISFTFTDLSTGETISFDNPKTGEYLIPLAKGNKMKLVLKASRAIGSYQIIKKTIKE